MGFFDKFINKKNVKPTYDTEDRYALEHRNLPQLVLGENGAATIASIIRKKGNFFVEMYHAMHKDEKQYVCPYSPQDFKVKAVRLEGANLGRFVLQIQMPTPERVPLCSNIFILHNEHLESRRYITAELSAAGTFMLCEWSRGGTHVNHGVFSEQTFSNVLMKLE